MSVKGSPSVVRRNVVFFALPFFIYSIAAHAQFDKLMQQLQSAGQQMQGTAPAGKSQTPGATPVQKKDSGLIPSESWCRTQAGVLSNLKPDTKLIAKEFKIENLESLQDEFSLALQKNNVSRTFPHASFFQREFETVKVRAIYDRFLAFPEPATLAALIQLSSSSDEQERGDALMALIFLHLQAPQLSVTPDRWTELAKTAFAHQHYTATVFRGRTLVYGEYAPKNIDAAVGYLADAGRLRSSYNQNDGIRKEFDSQNYELVHKATMKDILESEPKYRKQWGSLWKMSMQIEAAQNEYANRFASTRMGKVIAEVDKVNKQSLDKGDEIILKSQGGNQLAGQLASLRSLQQTKDGDKKTFVDINPQTHVAQLRMFERIDVVSPEQKKLLVEAQEKRYVAQGLLANSLSGMMAEMMGGFGDFIKMTAPLLALKQFNNALIQSCEITSKWDQAMRAKDVPSADKKKAGAEVASDLSKYKDE
jgi:hypothetical protein